MAGLDAPPIYNRVGEETDGKATLPWILFFNQIFTGDTGTVFSPIFSNLAIVGTSPVYTGKYFKLGQFSIFEITVTPGTSTSSTAATTFVNNYPLRMQADGICFAVTAGQGTNSGHCDASTNTIYVPGWTNVTTPLTILGIVRAN